MPEALGSIPRAMKNTHSYQVPSDVSVCSHLCSVEIRVNVSVPSDIYHFFTDKTSKSKGRVLRFCFLSNSRFLAKSPGRQGLAECTALAAVLCEDGDFIAFLAARCPFCVDRAHMSADVELFAQWVF